jgi:hypothetical protein
MVLPNRLVSMPVFLSLLVVYRYGKVDFIQTGVLCAGLYERLFFTG